MTSPAETLVISRDEYTDVVYPWVSPGEAHLFKWHESGPRTVTALTEIPH